MIRFVVKTFRAIGILAAILALLMLLVIKDPSWLIFAIIAVLCLWASYVIWANYTKKGKDWVKKVDDRLTSNPPQGAAPPIADDGKNHYPIFADDYRNHSKMAEWSYSGVEFCNICGEWFNDYSDTVDCACCGQRVCRRTCARQCSMCNRYFCHSCLNNIMRDEPCPFCAS